MIQMIINNAHGPLKSFMLMKEYTSFEQLYASAAVLKRTLKDPSVSGFFEAKPRALRKAPTPAPAPAPTTEGVTTSEQVNLVFRNAQPQPVQKFTPQFQNIQGQGFFPGQRNLGQGGQGARTQNAIVPPPMIFYNTQQQRPYGP